MRLNKKQQKIIIAGLCAIVLLMAVGYAAFQTVLNITGTSNITSNFKVKIANVTVKNVIGEASDNGTLSFTETSANFEADLINPGDSVEYEVTIVNEGNLNAKLEKITLSDTNNPAIKFTTSGITEGDVLNTGSNSTLLVKIEYLSSVTSDPASKTSDLTLTLDYTQVESGGIVPPLPVAADQLKEKVVTAGDGLYEDMTEAGRYVYRGATPNNYITFNNEAWRIISVESDNTLKIVKDGVHVTRQYDTPSGRYDNNYCNNSSWGCNVWGSKSTMLDGAGTPITQMSRQVNGTKYNLPTAEAALNTYLNEAYYRNLSAIAKEQIENHTFNAGVVGYDSSKQSLTTDYAQEKTNLWKGNIGLISATDYVKSSTNSSCTSVAVALNGLYPCKNNNYLYNSSYSWWTLSPASGGATSSVWYVGRAGDLTNYSANDNTFRSRPSLFLIPDITLSGTGTSLDPYVIE